MSLHQWQICCWRSQHLSYARIREKCTEEAWKAVPCDEGIARCLTRTALGQFWDVGYAGGTDFYLCEEDELQVVAQIRASAEELDCAPTSYILNLVYNAKVQRHASAVEFLVRLHCPRLAGNIDLCPAEPSKDWLRAFCERNSLLVRCVRPLQAIRRVHGNIRTLTDWFQNFSPIIAQYDPRLILNMDETGISSSGRFRVAVPEGMLPVSPLDHQNVHMTGVVTFSASGKSFTPGIILPKLQNLPAELQEFADDVNFFTSPNGWMTRDVFLSYCVNLVHEITLWRPTLPPPLRGQRILLLLDGHPSRKCYEGIEYLRQNGIDVITFPGHSTHLLQPFDLLVASALKAHLRKSTAEWNRKLRHAEVAAPATSAAGVKRYVLVESFVNGLQKALTTRVARQAFAMAGLCPLNPAIVLANPVVTALSVPEGHRDWVSSRCFSVQADHQLLAQQCGHPPGRPLEIADLTPRVPVLLTRLRQALVRYEIADF